MVKSPNPPNNGNHVIAWVKSLPEKSHNDDDSLVYTADVKIDAFDKGLVPFLWSTGNRPDGVLLRSWSFDGTEWKLPLLIVEVHSSPYRNTVSQTAVDVLDQLRLLRCFNANIAECVGFTFPKYPTTTASNDSFVTKVSVSYESFQFAI